MKQELELCKNGLPGDLLTVLPRDSEFFGPLGHSITLEKPAEKKIEPKASDYFEAESPKIFSSTMTQGFGYDS